MLLAIIIMIIIFIIAREHWVSTLKFEFILEYIEEFDFLISS